MVGSNCGETVNDLLHCSIARDIWSFVFSPFGVMWVMPYIMLDLLACWKGWVTLYYGIFAGLFLLIFWDIPVGSPWFKPGFPLWANGRCPLSQEAHGQIHWFLGKVGCWNIRMPWSGMLCHWLLCSVFGANEVPIYFHEWEIAAEDIQLLFLRPLHKCIAATIFFSFSPMLDFIWISKL